MRPGSSGLGELGVWLGGERVPTLGKWLEAGCQEHKPESEEIVGIQLVKEGWRRHVLLAGVHQKEELGEAGNAECTQDFCVASATAPTGFPAPGRIDGGQGVSTRGRWQCESLVLLCVCECTSHLFKTNNFLKSHLEPSDV